MKQNKKSFAATTMVVNWGLQRHEKLIPVGLSMCRPDGPTFGQVLGGFFCVIPDGSG